jgi:hypothetical protein
MGITKSNLFTEEQNELALFSKAFAHPARIAILEYLLKSNQCINSDLVQELGFSTSDDLSAFERVEIDRSYFGYCGGNLDVLLHQYGSLECGENKNGPAIRSTQ